MKKAFVLLLCLIVSILSLLSGCGRGEMIEIKPGPDSINPHIGRVYIEGDVSVPGIYPMQQDDTIDALLQAAGGYTGKGEPDECRIYFTSSTISSSQQKVDLNRAPRWLLEALPGIGEVTAEKIIQYRSRHGPFRHIRQLVNVEGIGQATFENLAGKITVAAYGE
ncbi:MAG: helix-hairpin-helix domain-containing protein [Dehalococcoidaceae bacterium]|nr:helix-hairpin-helix domain-containing protein [Dehalococcoidaceae bacterium]